MRKYIYKRLQHPKCTNVNSCYYFNWFHITKRFISDSLIKRLDPYVSTPTQAAVLGTADRVSISYRTKLLRAEAHVLSVMRCRRHLDMGTWHTGAQMNTNRVEWEVQTRGNSVPLKDYPVPFLTYCAGKHRKFCCHQWVLTYGEEIIKGLIEWMIQMQWNFSKKRCKMKREHS